MLRRGGAVTDEFRVKKNQNAYVAWAGTLAAGTAVAETCLPEHVLNRPRELENIPAAALAREVIANIRMSGSKIGFRPSVVP